MSLLIKGMDMPKDGCHHMICIYSDGTVSTGERVYTAISVPTPHGPLIDTNEIIEVQMLDEMYEAWTLKTMSVAEYLAFAADTPPIIIEAEVEKDDK